MRQRWVSCANPTSRWPDTVAARTHEVQAQTGDVAIGLGLEEHRQEPLSQAQLPPFEHEDAAEEAVKAGGDREQH